MRDRLEPVVVLGLGRMGAAILERLETTGRSVTGWTRSDGTDVREAVADARVVLLSLFDGPACLQVLDAVAPALAPGAIVVNTSTVSPEEARVLATAVPAYVHAPVIGSVPAARSGSLTLLVGSDDPLDPDMGYLLGALGTVRGAGSPADAAAAKLVVNSSLAGGLLALRDTLTQADVLGLDRTTTLDLLTHGALGGLVGAKRDRLAGVDRPADFTVAALAKDAALLAEATGHPFPAAVALESMGVPEADVAAVATERAGTGDVLEPLRAYVRGHATGESGHFREAFLSTAHIEGIRDGGFVSWPLEDYCALFDGHPAPDEAGRMRRIDSVDVHETVATATMTLHHGADTFTDIFLLVRTDAGWLIANKAYHRAARSAVRSRPTPAER